MPFAKLPSKTLPGLTLSLGLSLAALSLGACGQLSPPTLQKRLPVVGGRTVKASEDYASRVVAIRIGSGDEAHYCSGSIIAEDLILSAGHCLTGQSAEVEILFGVDATKDESVVRRVMTANYASLYTRWPRSKTADVALLQFAGGLPEGFQVNSFLPDTHALKPGETVILSGYGRSSIEKTINESSGILYVAERVKVLNPNYGLYDVSLDQKTATGAHGICNGDSGGAAFMRLNGELKLWGINVWVMTADCASTSGVQDARKHLPWIREQSEILRSNVR